MCLASLAPPRCNDVLVISSTHEWAKARTTTFQALGDQLTQQASPGLRKTYGIAVDGAATLLVAAGDNPARLRSDAAFAAVPQCLES